MNAPQSAAVSPRRSARPGHRTDIDGLRGLAIALVVVFHVFIGRVSAGVDVFLLRYLLLRPADPQCAEPQGTDGRPVLPAHPASTVPRPGHRGVGVGRRCCGHLRTGPLGRGRRGRHRLTALHAEPAPDRPGAGLFRAEPGRQCLPAHLVDVGADADLRRLPTGHRADWRHRPARRCGARQGTTRCTTRRRFHPGHLGWAALAAGHRHRRQLHLRRLAR